ncbi:MAG: glucose-6-phosphate isomerase [Candidatus Omnitrophica bacterium]|nr:glucose-6-phosphate isomerase [Candidatus Omnitrophota bacterium]MDE2009447.1 glucose-6-phosphate isomerase [Candidatus Omnitrophota bacterium]MDE2214658.1 glucose-6-phosphate isomerase [Candidatus Omnitrophota bacterium]MDE2232018.1 glucose-6-phosphate isomerase [Candidatus Omnitrophota bacterium]
MLTLNTRRLEGFVVPGELDKIFPSVLRAHDFLHKHNGPGAGFTGWLELPSRIQDSFIQETLSLAAEVQRDSEAIVSIGIGGSYLGIRATAEFLGGGKLPIYYAGHNISSDYLHRLLDSLKGKRTTVVVISKSGTTTEPAIAFRVIKKFLECRYNGEELKKRIICVTDEKKGALRKIAGREGYRCFVIPDDVGGRYSVLTPVGLVPLAMAGFDIASLVEGARKAQAEYALCDLEKNACYRYAALRNILYRQGKKIEVLASFYPEVFYVAEWFKQLFGESEGKQGLGIFPASLIMSTDLHSMGQWMQEAERTVFETFVEIDKPHNDVIIPEDTEDLDGFNYVAGKGFDFVNKKAYEATSAAHFEGGVPNMAITLCKADALHLGHLYYFFEKACGVSGYILGVNPFDQPGVEAYKKKMFALLGKR